MINIDEFIDEIEEISLITPFAVKIAKIGYINLTLLKTKLVQLLFPVKMPIKK